MATKGWVEDDLAAIIQRTGDVLERTGTKRGNSIRDKVREVRNESVNVDVDSIRGYQTAIRIRTSIREDDSYLSHPRPILTGCSTNGQLSAPRRRRRTAPVPATWSSIHRYHRMI